MTEPMTAAEYRKQWRIGLEANHYDRTLAALEEREALLGRVESGTDMGNHDEPMTIQEAAQWSWNSRAQRNFGDERAFQRCCQTIRVLTEERDKARQEAADASVGALVRRIREHAYGLYFKFPGSEVTYSLDAFGLSAALDSLLPKEPEVVTGPSGYEYQKTGPGGRIVQRRTHLDPVQEYVANEAHTPPCDAPVVAKLMGGKDG